MTILALDTSGPVCSVAVLTDQVLRYEARAVNKLTHSRSLMPMVDEAIQKSGIALQDITLIAAVIGPGSFTGVRIGVAAAQGIARGLQIQCLAVNAMEAMAYSVSLHGMVICPIRDARSGQVYGAAFSQGQRLIKDQALKLNEYLEQVNSLGESLFFLGDGALSYGEQIIQILGSRASVAPVHLLLPGAGAAAVLAFHNQDGAVDPGQLMPLYLRAPQAERLRAQKYGAL